MLKVILPKRTGDDFGSGEFGAPRGSRKHKGIDYVCPPDAWIFSNIEGTVTKLGYPYSDDTSYRYVEVTDKQGRRWRYFYVRPAVRVGQYVWPGERLGKCQDIQKRYTNLNPGKGKIRVMDNHVHLEIMQSDDTPINPENL